VLCYVQQSCICDVCGLGLSTRHALRTHSLVHKDGTAAAIPCKQCPKAFRHMQTYRKHMARVHEFTPDKRLRCATCGKYYNHKEGLARHLKKAHGGSGTANKFRCDVCPSAAFAFQYDLNRHVRRVHREQQGAKTTTVPQQLHVQPPPQQVVQQQSELILAEFSAATGGYLQI
jgi:uncharacterized C2H2 Zn-finger protein